MQSHAKLGGQEKLTLSRNWLRILKGSKTRDFSKTKPKTKPIKTAAMAPMNVNVVFRMGQKPTATSE